MNPPSKQTARANPPAHVRHSRLIAWVEKIAELTQPAEVFWCDGSQGLYIHPNIWHAAVVPLADHARFRDRQGKVHARISVDFVKEFGCFLAAPMRHP